MKTATTAKNLWNIVWKEDKFYVSQCLNVDVSSFGKTKKEAIANLTEALELYFEDEAQNNELTTVEMPELIKSTFNYA
ncbi:MAG TPA: type II toxin-antitoxin system HicB family antitoxin [Candidatus Woesebacteria bacterium]|jgi:predicted RNase H-like HicB family nuclease|nr:type II toxin-antitoxin system HicB family antitoxin [Candidatus Woesebacteria bacterium]